MMACKPAYRAGFILTRLAMVCVAIGLIVGISGKGWTVLIVGIAICLIGMLICALPNSYLAEYLHEDDPSLSPKEITDIINAHLRNYKSSESTAEFLYHFQTQAYKKRDESRRSQNQI